MMNSVFIKYFFLTSLLAALPLLADEEQPQSSRLQPLICADQFNYIRLGAGKVTPNSHTDIGAGIHVGRRYELDDAAVDISVNWVHGEGADNYDSSDFVSLPRIMYLNYETPEADSSLYFGPGVSLGWLYRDGRKKKFVGICLEGSVGYEFKRYSTIRTLVQLDVSQPLIAASKKGGIPGPVFVTSVGVGF